MANVKFGKGLKDKILASTPDPNMIYFAEDTQEIYKGGRENNFVKFSTTPKENSSLGLILIVPPENNTTTVTDYLEYINNIFNDMGVPMPSFNIDDIKNLDTGDIIYIPSELVGTELTMRFSIISATHDSAQHTIIINDGSCNLASLTYDEEGQTITIDNSQNIDLENQLPTALQVIAKNNLIEHNTSNKNNYVIGRMYYYPYWYNGEYTGVDLVRQAISPTALSEDGIFLLRDGASETDITKYLTKCKVKCNSNSSDIK